MTSLLGPPELFSAWSCAIDGQDPDEPLPPGIHLRVLAGLNGTFPLAPLAVFQVPATTADLHMFFSDEQNHPVSTTDLAQLSTAYAWPSFAEDDAVPTVGVELFAARTDFDAQLLDARGRIVAERRGRPALFPATALSRFRLTGADLQAMEYTRWVVNVEQALLAQPSAVIPVAGQPPLTLGLPVAGVHPWYVGVHSRDDALARVARGAPGWLSIMDAPVGPPTRLGPDDEVRRVESLLASATFGGGLESLAAALVADESAAPWRQTERQPLDAQNQVAMLPRLGCLQLASVDPGIARFLGFADQISPEVLTTDQPAVALAVVGVLAVDPDLAAQSPHLDGWLNQPDPAEAALIDLVGRTVRAPGQPVIDNDLDDAVQRARQCGLQVRAVVAFTLAGPPSLPPTPPAPAILDRCWQASDGVTASSRYRATFAFASAPLGALAAVASMAAGAPAAVAGAADGDWASAHDFLPTGGGTVASRAVPWMFGSESDPADRARAQLAAGSSVGLDEAQILAVQDLDAGHPAIGYRFWAADMFGRFGGPVQAAIGPPDRPAPPPPVLRYHLDLHEDDLASLPSAGPLSPGDVRLSVVVPGLDNLAAGSLPVKALTITLDGDSHEVDVTTPGLTELPPLPLAALAPQQSQSYALTATFTDSAGTSSPAAPSALVTFTVTDRRPLPVIPTGLGMFWASAPGPGPDVQLKPAWPARPGTRHRIYVIDQQGLELTDADWASAGLVSGAGPSRAQVAVAGANKVRHGGVVDRSRFGLLTDTATADSTGRAVLDTTLPRSLQTVKFLRIIPLNDLGAEAPFDQCGIVPVAVPDSRRPPPPQLDGTVDPVTGIATFTVIADGFDGVALRGDEPGLFDPAPAAPGAAGAAGTVGGAGGVGDAGVAAGAVAPRFRIRRAVSAVQDPVYAAGIAEGELAYDATQAPRVVFANRTAQDTNNGHGLEPFVRYVYWAQVRLPPERRLPRGVTPIDGAVTAADPANATDRPRPMSLPSAPRTLMRTPPEPPSAPPAGHVQVTRTPRTDGGVDLAIEITDPPSAHPMAIGPYQLAVWPQWPGQAILPMTSTAYVATVEVGPTSGGVSLIVTTGTITVTVPPPDAPGAVADPITLRLGYVDPIGRLSGLTTMTVP